MKRTTSLALILVVFTLVAASANADGVQEQEVTFTVDKMTCAVCPITVRKSMQRVDGVKDVTIDFDAKTATVIYDATRTDTKHIAKASSNVGYPATVIEDSTQ